jgi:peptide-methionine (R)-S-oxide reductase
MTDETTGRTDTVPTKAELRERLTRQQYKVTQKGGTERAFSGEYWSTKEPGRYHCIVCDTELFDSAAKYDSGTGWPSFDSEVEDGRVRRLTDRKFGMARVEARCARCDAHLGHVFPDGPATTGERYCMNSASLRLERSTDG